MKEKKIRVLQMPVRNAKGGITQYALRNWEQVDKSRFVFDWVTLDRELSFSRELVAQGCKVHHLSCRQEDDEPQFHTEMRAILAQGYDAVHLHTSYWRGFLAEELAVEVGVPRIIVHAHSTGIDVADAAERVKLLDAHNALKAAFSPSLATHFAACSVEAAEFLFGTQIPSEQVLLLKNAVDTDRFAFNKNVRDHMRARMGLDDKFVILQPARLVYQKNHDFMLEVFAGLSDAMPEVVLLLAGDGELFGALESRARELGISERVRFLGFRQDLRELYQAADLMVLPSLFEGLGIAAIEAQCSGVFCMLSEFVPASAVVSDNAMRLPLDAAKWCDAIVDIAQNSYDRRDRSAEVAAAGYSICEQIKVLEKLYAGE